MNATPSTRERAQRRLQARRNRQRSSIFTFLSIFFAIVLVAGVFLFSSAGQRFSEVLGLSTNSIIEPPTSRAEYVPFTLAAMEKASEYLDRGEKDRNGKLVGVDLAALAGLLHPITAGPELMLGHLAANDIDACDDLVDAINDSLSEIRDMMAQHGG